MNQRVAGGGRQPGPLYQILVEMTQLGVVQRPVRVFGFGGGEPAGDDREQPEAGGQEMGPLVTFRLVQWPAQYHVGSVAWWMDSDFPPRRTVFDVPSYTLSRR